jgi:hypothetical protein
MSSAKTQTPWLVAITKHLISWSTVLTGLYAVALWHLVWQGNWLGATLVVLLIYLHEIGHILTGIWRRLRPQHPPRFTLEGGAFVTLEYAPARAWDAALHALGGPIVGGAIALAVALAGDTWHLPVLTAAGLVALYINWINLLPLKMGWWQSDGLHVLTLARWDQTTSTRSRIRALYLGVFAVLSVGLALHVSTITRFWDSEASVPTEMTALGIAAGALLVEMLSARLTRYAVVPNRNLRTRYVTLALVGWAQPPYMRPWLTAVAACAVAHTVGWPGLRWLEVCVWRLQNLNPVMAGAACAFGYDLLHHDGQGEQETWLERMMRLILTAKPEAVESTSLHLAALGYQGTLARWSSRILESIPATRLSPLSANNLALILVRSGHAVEALPLARAAAAADPEHPLMLGTLGEVLLALGRIEEGKEYITASLKRRDNAALRDALDRALAARRRSAERQH